MIIETPLAPIKCKQKIKEDEGNISRLIFLSFTGGDKKYCCFIFKVDEFRNLRGNIVFANNFMYILPN